MAGSCLVCRRPFTRNVRLAAGRQWQSPHCGHVQLGPNAVAEPLKKREVDQVGHAMAQRLCEVESARVARLQARGEVLRAVRNGCPSTLSNDKMG
jgi:hypothetical protein